MNTTDFINSHLFDKIAPTLSGGGHLTWAAPNKTLTIASSNTYTGKTIIDNGTIINQVVDGLPITTSLLVNALGTYNTNNFNQTVGSLKGSGSVTLGTSTLTTGGNNTVDIFSGIISGNGSLVKNGSSSLLLSANNTLTGNITINGGLLTCPALGTSTYFGSNTSSTITVNPTGSFGGNTYRAVYAGTIVLNGGNIVNTGTSSFCTVNSRIVLTANSEIKTTLTTSSNFFNGTVNLSNYNLTHNITGGNAQHNAAITGAGGIIKIGVGNLLLAATGSTYTGNTTINAGTITVSDTTGTPLGNGSLGGTVTVNASGTLSIAQRYGSYSGTIILNGGQITVSTGASFTRLYSPIVLTANSTFHASTGGGTITGMSSNTINLNAHTLTCTGANVGYSGIISGTGSIVISNGVTRSFSGNNTYTGGTIINGTVVALHINAFGTGTITVNASGTLNMNGFVITNTIVNNSGTIIP